MVSPFLPSKSCINASSWWSLNQNSLGKKYGVRAPYPLLRSAGTGLSINSMVYLFGYSASVHTLLPVFMFSIHNINKTFACA